MRRRLTLEHVADEDRAVRDVAVDLELLVVRRLEGDLLVRHCGRARARDGVERGRCDEVRGGDNGTGGCAAARGCPSNQFECIGGVCTRTHWLLSVDGERDEPESGEAVSSP